MYRNSIRRGFTLIELLVVIAVIAILAVVVVLVLNPAELLRQSRDSNRVSDMATINNALGVYSTDQSGTSGFSLGSSSVVYISIPDPSATTTVGDQCQGLNLITLPATYTYHCAASSTFRNVNGTGWIPVNLASTTTGSPLGSLPIDPINQSSSRLYYAYVTNGTNYEVTSVMESQKYGVGGSNDIISNDGGPLASVYEKGSKLGLEPLDYGDPTLVSYWPLNEGTSSIAYDDSGNNATGSWSGTQAGTNGYYSSGKGSSWAAYFNGSNDRIALPASGLTSNTVSISAWFDPPSVGSDQVFIENTNAGTNGWQFGITAGGYAKWWTNPPGGAGGNLTSPSVIPANTWTNIISTYDGTTKKMYVNGVFVNSVALSTTLSFSGAAAEMGAYNASGQWLSGSLQNVRVYNRILSQAQITAIYSGGK